MKHEATPRASCSEFAGTSPTVAGQPRLLSDDQIQTFIVQGFLELPPSENELGGDFHASVFAATSQLGLQRAEELGNDILPALPQLARVFETPSCRGALTSLLGPGYIMHPHRFCHTSKPGRAGQLWHRDTFWGHWHPRNPRPYWLMALYFPQDTPVALGPTGVLPRSQYFNSDKDQQLMQETPFGCARFTDEELRQGIPGRHWHACERPLACRAGTVVIIHYDLWHRGAANVSESGVRFMFKFQFARMLSPADTPRSLTCRSVAVDWGRVAARGSTWHAGGREQELYEGDPEQVTGSGASEACLSPVWQSVWEWLCGGIAAQDGHAGDTGGLMVALVLCGDEHEPRRVAAAWRLGRATSTCADRAAACVVKLESCIGLGSRAAAQVLEALGPVALPALLAAPSLRRAPAAVHALGRILDVAGPAATNRHDVDQARQMLERLSTDAGDSNMRLCAVAALGCLRCCEPVHVLLRSLAGDPNSDVRAMACHSLLRLLTSGCLDDSLGPVRDAMVRVREGQESRYVAAYAAEALHRLELMRSWPKAAGSAAPAWLPALVRWCSCGHGWKAVRGPLLPPVMARWSLLVRRRMRAEQRARAAAVLRDRAEAVGMAVWRVVHGPRIAVRCRPETSAKVIGALEKGTEVVVSAEAGDWLLLSPTCRPPEAATEDEGEAWVLSHGAAVGFGTLLEKVRSQG
mmetsp:Transcript_98590/g.307617  ORF Transcript_98590/g.307617 Transcript_98590/m.307617 type:complete len:693 (-) Transcript_98590:68-2146(-)